MLDVVSVSTPVFPSTLHVLQAGSKNTSPDSGCATQSCCEIAKQILHWSGTSKHHLDVFCQQAQLSLQSTTNQRSHCSFIWKGKCDWFFPWRKRRLGCLYLNSWATGGLIFYLHLSPAQGRQVLVWKGSCDLVISQTNMYPISHPQPRRTAFKCPSSFFIWKRFSDFPLRASALTKSIHKSYPHTHFSETFSSSFTTVGFQSRKPGGWWYDWQRNQ